MQNIALAILAVGFMYIAIQDAGKSGVDVYNMLMFFSGLLLGVVVIVT